MHYALDHVRHALHDAVPGTWPRRHTPQQGRDCRITDAWLRMHRVSGHVVHERLARLRAVIGAVGAARADLPPARNDEGQAFQDANQNRQSGNFLLDPVTLVPLGVRNSREAVQLVALYPHFVQGIRQLLLKVSDAKHVQERIVLLHKLLHPMQSRPCHRLSKLMRAPQAHHERLQRCRRWGQLASEDELTALIAMLFSIISLAENLSRCRCQDWHEAGDCDVRPLPTVAGV
mmetsp:Transcript_3688/g.10615  ORF Transcript_3688/g.10615 Transcript_3688/m.10615 type:complete len:232 (+) Transcript_3688:257-952(+)